MKITTKLLVGYGVTAILIFCAGLLSLISQSDGNIIIASALALLSIWITGRLLIRDLNERKQHANELFYLVNFDHLTELPNRRRALHLLDEMLTEIHENNVGVMICNLDKFKPINDSLGHKLGDQLIKTVGQRIKSYVKSTDVVARIDADVFVVILRDIENVKQTHYIARKIIRGISEMFDINGHEVYTTISIGISSYPNDGSTSEELFKNAGTALVAAKGMGGNCLTQYTEENDYIVKERLRIVADMHRALDNDEFETYYQPQIDGHSGKIVGCEALVRWNHPRVGIISPIDFIPLAEESDLIVNIGERVLRTAFSQMKEWMDMGLTDIKTMSVNISNKQFHRVGFVDRTKKIIKQTGVDIDFVELELVENIIMKDNKIARRKMKKLKDMGIKLAIDDFGTGHSSLSHLKQFPVDTLKIDRAFVMDIPKCEDAGSIVKTIIMLAKTLKLGVVSEGIETKAQQDFLVEHGCDSLQGFMYSKAQPAKDIERMMKEGNSLLK